MVKKRIIVSGVDGAMAGSFCRQFKKKYDIIGISRRRNNNKTIRWDLSESKNLLLKKSAAFFIHFAGMSDVVSCERNKHEAFLTNCVGTLNALEFAKKNKIKKFMYVSTGSVYATSNKKHRETDELHADTTYEQTKILAEKICKGYTDELQVIVVRPFFPYGPGTKPGRIVDQIIQLIRNNKSVTLHRGAKPTMTPLYIQDFNHALSRILEKEKKTHSVINIAGNEAVTVRGLAEQIAQILNKKPKFKRTTSQAPDFMGDCTKLKKYFKQEFSLKSGLRETINAE